MTDDDNERDNSGEHYHFVGYIFIEGPDGDPVGLRRVDQDLYFKKPLGKIGTPVTDRSPAARERRMQRLREVLEEHGLREEDDLEGEDDA
jgi:hypothetical protein